MPRRLMVIAAFLAVSSPWALAVAGQNVLIPETTAARHGLTRPWFTQLELAQEQARVTDVILCDGVLYIQTDTAVVQAVDAETGKTLWSRQVGRPGHPSITPDANNNLLVVVNGSRLYVVNRHNGALLYERAIDGAPVAGIAVSLKRAYVPMIDGMIVGFPLDQLMDVRPVVVSEAELEEQLLASSLPSEKPQGNKSQADKKTDKTPSNEDLLPDLRIGQELRHPVSCQSPGQVVARPIIAMESRSVEHAAWCTNLGQLNLASVDRKADDVTARLTLQYRMAIESPILCSPAYLQADPEILGDTGLIFVASSSGFVHAVRENQGDVLWRFSTGETIVRSPVVFDERLYVATERGGMFCLDVKTGKSIWCAPNIVQFVAAGKSRVYGVDPRGQIAILNAENGARLDTLPAENIAIKFCNNDTDRIYLISERGVVQCLREIEQTQPIVYRDRRKQMIALDQDASAEKKKPAESKAKKGAEASQEDAPAEKKAAAAEPPAKKDAAPKKAKSDANPDADPFNQ